MNQFNKIFFSLLLSSYFSFAQAAISVYQFDDEEKSTRFKHLTEELRCPKCQNQNIADSNAEIASDLRQKLHEMLSANKSDDEIVQYMVDRYGDFVLYEPKIKKETYLLWFGPFALLIFALSIVFLIVRMRKQRVSPDFIKPLDSHQQRDLEKLLKEHQESNE